MSRVVKPVRSLIDSAMRVHAEITIVDMLQEHDNEKLVFEHKRHTSELKAIPINTRLLERFIADVPVSFFTGRTSRI